MITFKEVFNISREVVHVAVQYVSQNHTILTTLNQWLQSHMSSCIDSTGSSIFCPGLNAGIPRYGHAAQRKASPR